MGAVAVISFLTVLVLAGVILFKLVIPFWTASCIADLKDTIAHGEETLRLISKTLVDLETSMITMRSSKTIDQCTAMVDKLLEHERVIREHLYHAQTRLAVLEADKLIRG